MLRPAGDRPGAFLADLSLEVSVRGAGVDVDRLGRHGDVSFCQPVGRNEFRLSRVPRLQYLGRWSTAENAGMD